MTEVPAHEAVTASLPSLTIGVGNDRGLKSMDEADATLIGEVMALRTIVVLLLRQLDQGGTLPPGWTALARKACLRSVADMGRQAEGPLTDVMLDSALATIASLFGPIYAPGER